MENERMRVSIPKILSEDLKEHLKLRYALSSTDLANMSMSTMFHFMSLETKVKSKARFLEELETALFKDPIKVIPFENIGTMNHREFYFSQVAYCARFTVLLGIMLAANSDHIPVTNAKKGGLIDVFRKYNDYVYVNECIAAMKNYRWRDMGLFLQEYKAVCLELYEVSQTARQLPYKSNKVHLHTKGDPKQDTRGNHGSGDSRNATHDSRNNNPRMDPKGEPWNSSRNVQFDRNRPRQFPARSTERHASNIYGYDSKVDSSDDTYWNTSYEYGTEEEDDAWRRSYLREDGIPCQSPQEIQNIVECSISAILGSGGGVEEFGCLKKIMHGTCTSRNCNYNHTSAAMDKTAKDIGGKCSSYLSSGLPKSNDGQGNAQPTAIMSRTPPGPRT
jgi:hypothetical protein